MTALRLPFILMLAGVLGLAGCSVHQPVSLYQLDSGTPAQPAQSSGMAVLLGPLVTLLFFNLASSANLRDISRGAEVALWVMAGVAVLETATWYGIPGFSQAYEALSLIIHAETNEYYPQRMRLTAFEASWAAVMLTFIFPFAMTRATPLKLFLYAGFVILAMILAQSRTAMLVIGIQYLVLLAAFMRRRKDYIVHCVTAVCIAALTVLATPGVGESVATKVSNLIEFGSVDGMIDKDGGVENVSNITRLAAVRAGMSMFQRAHRHPAVLPRPMRGVRIAVQTVAGDLRFGRGFW